MSEEERKLFVAGLSEAITEAALREMFKGAGATITDLSIPRDRATGKARGFAFLTLESGEQAAPAMAALDGSFFDGNSISVRPFRSERNSQVPPRSEHGAPRSEAPRSEAPRSVAPRSVAPRSAQNEDATLYVGNLPFDAESEDVTAFFSEAGFEGVRRVHLPTDPEGRKRGFGFVTLEDAEAAKRAGAEMEGKSFRGRSLSVNLARRGGSPGSGGSGGPPGSVAPRSFRPSRGPEGPASGPRSQSPPPMSQRPPPSFPDSGVSSSEIQRRDGARREKKKEKKTKGRGLSNDRGHQRRRNEGFGAPRARGSYDDWDDD